MQIKNKKAFFEYRIIERFIAGISLVGSEIKSAREGKISFVDSFCQFTNGELYIRNMHIAVYDKANIWNHEPKRDRKLLLQRKELHRLDKSLVGSGMTIVPLSAFISDKGFLKIEIGLVKGKNLYDKRESIKEKDLQRNNDRYEKI